MIRSNSPVIFSTTSAAPRRRRSSCDAAASHIFFFPAEDGIRAPLVTGVQTCALPLSDGTTNTGVSFAYWTAPVFTPPGGTPPFDTTYNMLSESGLNAPAPWVPFTRAGCSFGAFATANTVLENIGIDIPTVFGPSSPEAAEVAADPGQAFADFVGVAVHCAAGAATCSAANSGRPDLLPQEPGGYTGHNGLFGAKYVSPVISPGGPMRDLDGRGIQDAAGHVGFS